MEIPYIVTPRKDTGLNNAKIAIWLFLASEVMLFGGLFSSYIFLRIFADFPWPERALPVLPGLVNTFILIASSVTVVFAWASIKLGNWKKFVFYMSFTLICAAVFLVFKFFEYDAKLHHTAITYNDHATIEGHAHPEDHGHGGNFLAIDAQEISFKIAATDESYLQEILTRLGEHTEIVAKSGYKFTSVSGDTFTEEALIQPGEVIEHDKLAGILADAKSKFLEARVHNQNLRTSALNQAWANVRANKGDNFSKVQGLSHHNKKVVNAVNEEHRRIIEENEIGTLFHQDDAFSVIVQHSKKALKGDHHHSVKVAPDWGYLTDKTVGETSLLKLKDGTDIKGVTADSSIHIAVDAIDFRPLVFKARDREVNPDPIIEASALLNDNSEGGKQIKKLWETHKVWRALYATHLLEHYGNKKDGSPKRVPTDVDMYRVTWQQIIAYGRLDHNITSWDAPDAHKPGMIEGFTGANHKSKELKKFYPELAVARDQMRFESVFSPKMNNYYAIYFTITGLHGLHIIGGMIVLGYYLFFGYGMFKSNPEWLASRVEVAGLFWHFVDLVWIFVFPIFYLM